MTNCRPKGGTASGRLESLIRAGVLPGIPLDPIGTPFEIDPDGTVRLSRTSPLLPLPEEPRRVRTAPAGMTDIPGIVAAAAAGAVIGSFLNVCIYRLPLGTSIVWPGSACPHCGRPLAWYENIPIVSYLALGGRCRSCRDRSPLAIRSSRR